MHVLITGGAGFIGSNLIPRLLEKNHEIHYVVDNLSAGEASKLRAKQIERTYKQIEVAEYNVLYIRSILRDIKKGFIPGTTKPANKIDAIVHLASPVSVAESIENPDKYRDEINKGTARVLEGAKECGINRVIIASTAAVYGNPEKTPLSEDSRIDPVSPYGYEKFAAEALSRIYSREHGMETIILRLFNVYGPGQDHSSPYAGAISNVMRRLKEGKAPLIFGDGKQTRDFVNITDVCDAIILALELEKPEPGLTLNIGSGNAATLNSVVESCIALSGNNVQPVYQPQRAGDIRNSQADISKARKCLGYAPKITLEEGLKATWNWLNNTKT